MAYADIDYRDVWDKMMVKRIDIDARIVCQEWQNYQKWLGDVTQLPGADPTAIFRRYNALLPYQPGNVRWVPRGSPKKLKETPTSHTPRKNQVYYLTHNGQPITQKEAAAILGTTHGAFWQKMYYRHQRDGQTHFDLNDFLWS